MTHYFSLLSSESSDEGVGSLSDASDDGGSELQHENVTLRHQLEVERQRCATLEERNSFLETQLLTVLQVQAPHSSSLSVSLQTSNLALTALNRGIRLSDGQLLNFHIYGSKNGLCGKNTLIQ